LEKSLIAPAKWQIPHKLHPSPARVTQLLRCTKVIPQMGPGAKTLLRSRNTNALHEQPG
jgi:hypothetical protein